MVKKFEEFVNENVFDDMLSRSIGREERKEDEGLKYVKELKSIICEIYEDGKTLKSVRKRLAGCFKNIENYFDPLEFTYRLSWKLDDDNDFDYNVFVYFRRNSPRSWWCHKVDTNYFSGDCDDVAAEVVNDLMKELKYGTRPHGISKTFKVTKPEGLNKQIK